MHYRSQLFVPGNRPDRFDKACKSEADLVCIDLEDAVGPADKDSARSTVLNWLSETEYKQVSLRINSVDTEAGMKDIAALQSCGLTLPFIMIPKIGAKSEIKDLDLKLPDDLGAFFCIIESARGLMNSKAILSHDRVKLAMYGSIDYAGDVQCDQSWDTHLFGRSKLVMEAAVHSVLLFDGPHVDVRNLEDCEKTTRRAKGLGIQARSAIHPAQIAPIHKALAPNPEELEQAKAVVQAYEQAQGNVVLLNGKFVEAPVVKQAQRLISISKRYS